MKQRLEVFPQGNFLVLMADQPVAYTTNQIMQFDPQAPAKNWIKCTNGGYSGVTHDSSGNALYLISTGVHAAFRRKGVGRAIYDRRIQLAKECKLSYIFANFRIQTLRDNLQRVFSIEERQLVQFSDSQIKDLGKRYLAMIETGEINDPLRIVFERGFKLLDIVPWYMQDIESMHTGAYMYKALN